MSDADRSRFSSWLRGVMNDGPVADALEEKLITVLAYQQKALAFWKRHPMSIDDVIPKALSRRLFKHSQYKIRQRAFNRYFKHHLNVKFAQEWREIKDEEENDE